MYKFILLFALTSSFVVTSSIDKLGFYKAFQSDKKATMDSKITALHKYSASNQKDAYLGALTMKKSQFEKTPKEKAQVFKSGKVLLEKAITKAPKRVEYRFLRLAIQENTPKILKYNTKIKEDSDMIHSSYKTLDATLKRVVKKYAESSKNLNSQLLK